MYRSIMFVRFSLSDRIGHWVFAFIVLFLILTGFSQMFPMNPLSLGIINNFGGIEDVRLLHHYFGFLFFMFILYLAGTMAYRAFIRRIPITFVPTWEDVKDVLLAYRYNLELSNVKPPVGRCVLTKKTIFWALIWGSIIMVVSGFMLLNPIAVTTIFPGVIIPMAKTAHGFEAILVVLTLIVWHSYFFLMKYLDAAISRLHPEIKKEHMIDHPIETVDLYDERVVTEVDEETIETYWRYHLPAYLLVCGALLLGAFYFVNFETTSILTLINPENVRIYAPEETRAAIPESGESLLEVEMAQRPESISSIHSWKSCIGMLLLTNCVNCHETRNITEVDLRDYRSIIDSGLVVPGMPDESRLLIVLSDERHMDRYSTRLFDTLYDWVSMGALEVNMSPELEERYRNITWESDIRQMLTTNCVECHGSAAYHDLDFRSYYSTIDSGAIVLGSPDESTMLIKIGEGGHPGQFSSDELLMLHEWIGNGAPSGMTSDEAAVEYREIALGGFEVTGEEAPAEEETEIEIEEELPQAALAWDTGISGIFSSSCTTCHGSNAVGGLDLSSYETAMASNSIIPGDPEGSPLVIKMRSGSHPALLSDEDLDTVIQWILDGALETVPTVVAEEVEAVEEIEEETPGMRELWDAGIGSIFESCTMCHGSNAVGGVDLTSYDSAIASGVIIPGDPDGSPLVVLMESGSHSSLLSEDDLASVREWISVGE
jgi:cytochrome b subunit of formate dehydrogenase/mono/diheme cytochrome c family protein